MLSAAGLTVLIDDRMDQSAGIKFKDADLLGMPVRITISPRAKEKGGMEVRNRRTGAVAVVPSDGLLKAIQEIRNLA